MKHMWSPWRSDYVDSWEERQDRGGDDVFERIGREPDLDDENYVLWRGEFVYVVMNLYPYNNGHLMIVPFRPVESWEELNEDEQREMSETLSRALDWLRSALNPDGFNVGMNIGAGSGAGIPKHLHMHVVPRWSGDTNFMPVTAYTKVIPEGVERTYRKLLAQIAPAG